MKTPNSSSPSAAPGDKLLPPERVVVTGGMPYGNKDLHFGHIGGMFVHADVFARFMRDRIGKENVLFVSGTDCYGSPVVEAHRQALASGSFSGSLEDFVRKHHDLQRDILEQYSVAPDLFAASGIGPAKDVHARICNEILRTLHANGHLVRLSSAQFYDPKAEVLLNGRQVVGRCPIPGCKSEQAYADECALGHPYEPKDLIAPKSALTGETPELKEVSNWYLDLPKFHSLLESWTRDQESAAWARSFVMSGIREFLEPPAIYVKADAQEQIDALAAELPPFESSVNKNQALKLVFENLEAREAAMLKLREAELRFRAGKTLVPFRLSGNVDWGVPCPELEGHEASSLASTWWVWPESLIAALSFCQTALEQAAQKKGEQAPADAWRSWWCQRGTAIVQFIGEDNLYFYSLAETGLFLGLQGSEASYPLPSGAVQTPTLVVNNHILYFDKKASSSGALKPPMARDLLRHYTSDQLRAHFLSLALGQKSVGFKPKPLNPDAGPKDADPVLKEAFLLSNAMNKAVRTLFHTLHKSFEGRIPEGPVSAKIRERCLNTVSRYEQLMLRHVFHEVMALLDSFVRDINKHWTQNLRVVDGDLASDTEKVAAVRDNLHLIRTATALLHPIAPQGTETIREYLNLEENFWSWSTIHMTLQELLAKNPQHKVRELPPRFDFFPKHEDQIPS